MLSGAMSRPMEAKPVTRSRRKELVALASPAETPSSRKKVVMSTESGGRQGLGASLEEDGVDCQRAESRPHRISLLNPARAVDDTVSDSHRRGLLVAKVCQGGDLRDRLSLLPHPFVVLLSKRLGRNM